MLLPSNDESNFDIDLEIGNLSDDSYANELDPTHYHVLHMHDDNDSNDNSSDDTSYSSDLINDFFDEDMDSESADSVASSMADEFISSPTGNDVMWEDLYFSTSGQYIN